MILSKSAPQFFICGETLLKTRSAHKLFPTEYRTDPRQELSFPAGIVAFTSISEPAPMVTPPQATAFAPILRKNLLTSCYTNLIK